MKTVGWIVLRDGHRPVALAKANVLWFRTSATLFPTYGAARSAIRRTNTYERRHRYTWSDFLGKLYIERVTLADKKAIATPEQNTA